MTRAASRRDPARGGGARRPGGQDSNAPMAFAALEMAVADAHLRAEGRSFADLLGVAGRSVPVGAVVGTHRSVGDLTEEVTSLVEEGYSRVKLKIGPGWDLVPVAAAASLAARSSSGASHRRSGAALDPGRRQRLLPRAGRRSSVRRSTGIRLLCSSSRSQPGDLEAHVTTGGAADHADLSRRGASTARRASWPRRVTGGGVLGGRG